MGLTHIEQIQGLVLSLYLHLVDPRTWLPTGFKFVQTDWKKAANGQSLCSGRGNEYSSHRPQVPLMVLAQDNVYHLAAHHSCVLGYKKLAQYPDRHHMISPA